MLFLSIFLTHTLPLAFSGERVAERILGLWFRRVCDAMLWQPCFPREFTGVFQPECTSSQREGTAHPKHSHVLEPLFVLKCDRARSRGFFLWLSFVKSNLCHSQISIICGSNLYLATLFHNPSNHEKLFPLMLNYGLIITVALLSPCLYIG